MPKGAEESGTFNMTVIHTFRIQNRGLVFHTVLDGPCPAVGSRLVRRSDGQTWTVLGIERFNRMPIEGEPAGILVSSGPEPQVGDEIERWNLRVPSS